MKKYNAARRVAVEAAANIRFSAKIHGENIERGRRLRKGPRMRLISGKRRIR